MTVDKSFLGTGWHFPPQFIKATGGVIMVALEEDIRESLHILLNTAPGERTMQPSYGCGLRNLVFDSVTENTVTALKDAIDRAILFFEPRITLLRIDVDTSAQYDGVLKIKLSYLVRETNSRGNMVYPFYFKEGTQIRL
ncbi:MAG: GPW/gp25 family protein [Desulfatitalea sp.]|nr:GPW/gp25 family protein [Desulfatitalea sp.]NNK00614.1 GPW/gp25 family protein [Desulfatitalea sp.]